ncbi:M3 family metallopeptidase [Streptomyces sp. NBC_01190]|uniref:M3 family metallopeptidase n=1 Tax=Streptomyces sp. NBC_01190 TaxID=2903767 RepID=UPI00386A1DDF|nr:M3 family metallopeptidase [Streptomyces sp. NBC_01190]
MPVDPIIVPDRESLSEMDDALATMMTRLREITAAAELTQDTLIEITSIYNNVAYIFLYLEANDEFVNFDRLLPWRDAFHKDHALDVRILAMLESLRCDDPEAEDARLAYVQQLREKLETPDPQAEEELERLLSQAKDTLGAVRQQQAGLLERLKASPEGTAPPAVFYLLSSRIDSAATRRKLGRAWRAESDKHLDRMVALVDSMVAVRRRRSAAAGHPSVLAETLVKCMVGEDEAAAFLDDYLARALAGHETLESEVRDVLGGDDGSMDHFAYCLRSVSRGLKPPLFDLDGCLDVVFTVARRVFGLAVEPVRTGSAHVLTVTVRRDGEEIGQVNFDLWDTETKTVGANHTKGIRNRTEWSGLVQRPVAYVSCRFQPGTDGTGRITFQNLHSLFHEFGHAVNHLLIRKRVSNRSGLEYLPLERLEFMSMWFEKWAYHPDLGPALGLSAHEEEGLALCRRAKMLEYRRTYLERAVTSVLDFDVHRRGDGGIAQSFHRLDERFGIGRYCALGDFPLYFTWPMFTANPGANFAYPFGAAFSAQTFTPFLARALDESAPADAPALFGSCVDFDAPTSVPGLDAVFSFYDEAVLRTPATAQGLR